MKKIIIFILTSFSCTIAQIDTTIWYPLQIGNIWQYHYSISISESYNLTIEVIGDTVINENIYFILNSWNGHTYQRVEDNQFVFEYNSRTNKEYLRYNFVSPDRSIWPIDSINGQYGIYETFLKYIHIYGDTLESKIYNSAYIDTSAVVSDTSWSSMVDGLAIVVTKGLGITEYGQGINYGSFVGAIINGNKLGIVTSVSRSNNIEEKYYLHQNYPNPFNPLSVIEFFIPESGVVELLIYNSIGEKVDELLNSFLLHGIHQITFNGSKLSSGVYFYVLRTKNYVSTKKMLLIK